MKQSLLQKPHLPRAGITTSIHRYPPFGDICHHRAFPATQQSCWSMAGVKQNPSLPCTPLALLGFGTGWISRSASWEHLTATTAQPTCVASGFKGRFKIMC